MEKAKEIAQALLEVLEENIKLKVRINKAIEYINSWVLDEYSIAVIDKKDDLCYYEPKAKEKLLKMLGDKENVNK